MTLGHLDIEGYLRSVNGLVAGGVNTDAKNRYYRRQYAFESSGDQLCVRPEAGSSNPIRIPKKIDLTEALVAFFGLYSGDGAKGTDSDNDPGKINPSISFSQRERHIVRFAADQFRAMFPREPHMVFSIGEDSAHFLDGQGKVLLDDHYMTLSGSGTPSMLPLSKVRPRLSDKDRQYLSEKRADIQASNEDLLAFYFQHKQAMESILVTLKAKELASVGIKPGHGTKITASVRRPYKKGARQPGGSSRSDELSPQGLATCGELFLKLMHEIEDSILRDADTSSQGLVRWKGTPSSLGEALDVHSFYSSHPYGRVNLEHPTLLKSGTGLLGQWPHSKKIKLSDSIRIDPLWCFVAGLYLAEGSTPKEVLFRIFRTKPGSMSLGFTSSEGSSLELMLRALRKLFSPEDCLDTWKIKVGNQYFPELVLTGLKHGVPMLRGGAKGEGKLRTMEISLEMKSWALSVADSPLSGKSLLHSDYSDHYSHVEPTGAGVARIDFSASAALCRWYFPLLMYTVFGGTVADPTKEFYDA